LVIVTFAAAAESIVTDPVAVRPPLELGVVEVSVAVFVIAPVWVTLKVIVSDAVAPSARVPTVQVSVSAAKLAVPTVGAPIAVSVTPVGRGSLILTPAAASGPSFVTVRV
jgi:hypothetical protein